MRALRIPRSLQEQRILWDPVEKTVPKEKNITELLTRQAATSPRNVALVWGSGSLTYADLESRSNRVANSLHSLGMGPDVVVATCTSRSPESVVAALGILKAGERTYLSIRNARWIASPSC